MPFLRLFREGEVVMSQTQLKIGAIDLFKETEQFYRDHIGAGAIASFCGHVRSHSKSGRVDYLYLDWYPGFSEKTLDQIARDAHQRFSLLGLKVVHGCETIMAGEPIVFVAAASDHRRAALEAVDYMMDRLKSEAGFWKKEVGEGGEVWIDPTPQDGLDLNRWNEK